MWVIAQCFAAVSGILMIYSSYSKTKDQMLKVQVVDTVCCAIASALLGGWTAVILDALAIVRNNNPNWKHRFWVVVCLWVAAVVAVLFWDKLGLLPLLAEVLYTVSVLKSELAWTKAALAFNLALWACYDFCISAYTLVLTDCITFICILIQGMEPSGGQLFSLKVQTSDRESEEREVSENDV